MPHAFCLRLRELKLLIHSIVLFMPYTILILVPQAEGDKPAAFGPLHTSLPLEPSRSAAVTAPPAFACASVASAFIIVVIVVRVAE